MKNSLLLFIAYFLFFNAGAASTQNIHTEKWNGIDVVWVEDNSFPHYFISVYFADGALGDGNQKGSTEAALDFMTMGTQSYDQKQIADNLEFFGASYGARVTHEYSSYMVSGLVKDVIPTMKMICHMFDKATYPDQAVGKELNRKINALQNLTNDHRALASKAFRELLLYGSPFSYPVGGKVKDLKRIRSRELKSRLNELNQKVKKRIYLSGPKEVLNIKKVVLEECGWNSKASFVRTDVVEDVENFVNKKAVGTRYFLLDVPSANQSQVRIGKHLKNPDKFQNQELLTTATHYFGGGFTSVLMRELRTKRGLVYGAGAFASAQKLYGLAGISTATQVNNTKKLLNVISDTVKNSSDPKLINQETVELAKKGLIGSYPFQFEETKAYVSELMFLDHLGKPYDVLIQFPEMVREFSYKDIASTLDYLFQSEEKVILVLAPKSLKSDLKEIGDFIVIEYQDFL